MLSTVIALDSALSIDIREEYKARYNKKKGLFIRRDLYYTPLLE
jgi:hypothetical protein